MTTISLVIIDDSLTVCRFVEVTLRREEYTVTSFQDPRKTLMEIFVEKTCPVPDLFFVDLELPHLDGYQVMQTIKAKTVHHPVPMVVITRRSGMIDRLKARLAGAVEYMEKPVLQEQIVALVRRYFPKRDFSQQDSRQR